MRAFFFSLLLVFALAGLNVLAEHTLLEYTLRILLLSGIYIIAAVGLHFITGIAGQFSLGHAGFMGVGAYTSAWVTTALENQLGVAHLSGGPALSQFWIFTVGLLCGAAAAALVGLAVGMPSLRLRGDYLAIVTLGFAEMMRLLVNNVTFLGGATGYSGTHVLGLTQYTNVFWVFLCVIMTFFVFHRLTRSRYGRALRTLANDELVAQAMGIPVTRFKVTAFMLSAASAGVAGALFAHLQSSIRPDDFRLERSIDILVMVIIGGLTNLWGAAVGALLVTLSLELMRQMQHYRLLAYGLVLIAIMTTRPQGLFGYSAAAARKAK